MRVERVRGSGTSSVLKLCMSLNGQKITSHSPARELVPCVRTMTLRHSRIRAQNDLGKSEREPGKARGCLQRQVQGSTEQIWGTGRKPKQIQGKSGKIAALQERAGGYNGLQAEH